MPRTSSAGRWTPRSSRSTSSGCSSLKRASDEFDAVREQLRAELIAEGRTPEEAKTATNTPLFYRGKSFFVPEEARWRYIKDKSRGKGVGGLLNKALDALAQANSSALEGVLEHIDFTRKVGQSTIPDKRLQALIDHFDRYRLRNEDFEFPDLLGAAYEYLIGQFADSAGKKGGEFYTPRGVVRMMVRLVKPGPGMRVYDPCSGSGGMLIHAKEYVEEHGQDWRSMTLAGQEYNGGTWAVSKMNMILHGVLNADLRNDDTLANPLHKEGGELMRFDRVLTNPPFFQNCSTSGMEHPERFRYGFTPQTGKKADLMFAQHVLAVLMPNGIGATVMPHGVLFRGGEEKNIRQKIIEADRLEAVIGLAPNLFYGTGIPARVLVLRGRARRPQEGRGKVLFINADREYTAGRAQNYLDHEHIEKIVSAYEEYRDIPGFARVVDIEELRENDFNLNIRRYVDNTPPPSLRTSAPTCTAASPSARSRPRLTCSAPSTSTPPPSSPNATRVTTTSSPKAGSERPNASPNWPSPPKPACTRRSPTGGPATASAWPNSPTPTPSPASAANFSTPSSPNSNPSASSTATNWPASSPLGGATPRPTSRPSPPTASKASSKAGSPPSAPPSS